MSFTKDLDEYTEAQLTAEFNRRCDLRHAGKCDYCGRPRTEPPCKFPERHRQGPPTGPARISFGEPDPVSELEFVEWPKIFRFNRETIVTEKIDGTNSAIVVREDGVVYAQSRSRVIFPDADNFGFAAWVHANHEQLREQLGVGRHFGEWWGSGIQRGYGLTKGEKRFSLFNTSRWTSPFNKSIVSGEAVRVIEERQNECVECPLCHVVPILGVYPSLGDVKVESRIYWLTARGSQAAPGFMKPEGIVIYHTSSNQCFKVTCVKDEKHKNEV
jgi:hypothetical protein